MNFKQYLKKLTLDIIPVFIGILLAVLINNWRQNIADRNYYRHSLNSIVQEFQENIEELNYAISRQEPLMDSLKLYLEVDSLSPIQVVVRAKGMYTPDLKSTTWYFILQDSKHTLVTYEMISKLSEIDKYAELIKDHSRSTSGLFYQKGILEDPAIKRLLLMALIDLKQQELQQIELLEEFINTVKDSQ